MNELIEFSKKEKRIGSEERAKVCVDPIKIIAVEQGIIDSESSSISIPSESSGTTIHTDKLYFTVAESYEEVLEKIENFYRNSSS